MSSQPPFLSTSADASLGRNRPGDALVTDLDRVYESIYATDLVYVKDCWKLCGDAHCCSFQRYKSRFRIIGREPFQELPLLPGEWAWLGRQGWQEQFQPFEFKSSEHRIDGRLVRLESVISRRRGCACDHATRPSICRLYPLLPCFDDRGALVGAEPAGIYEEIERIGGLPKACRLENLPFDQLSPFLSICAALGSNPLLRWHLQAYALTKRHVARRLEERVRKTGKDVFAAFEGLFLRSDLIDQSQLHAELASLMRYFDQHWPGWDAMLVNSTTA